MSNPAFENVLGGKLSFKKGGADTIAPAIGKKKHRKKKKKKKGQIAKPDDSTTEANLRQIAEEQDEVVDTMTPAEKKYADEMERRERRLISELAAKTHREKVADFNKKLEEWTDHHDIPKIQSAGLG